MARLDSLGEEHLSGGTLEGGEGEGHGDICGKGFPGRKLLVQRS